MRRATRTIYGGLARAGKTSHDDTAPEMKEIFQATKLEEQDALLRRERKTANDKQLKWRAQSASTSWGSSRRGEDCQNAFGWRGISPGRYGLHRCAGGQRELGTRLEAHHSMCYVMPRRADAGFPRGPPRGTGLGPHAHGAKTDPKSQACHLWRYETGLYCFDSKVPSVWQVVNVATK